MGADPAPLILHASAVAVEGRGVLIRGASGSGKSSLALEMMAYGATLVADDRVVIQPDEPPRMSAPQAIAGLIEGRGVGLIRAPHAAAPLTLVVDMDQTETERLPQARETVIAGQVVPCLYRVASPAFAAMVLAILKGGRESP